MKITRFNVLGVALSAMNLGVATEAILEAVKMKRKGYVCVTGVHGVTEAQGDEGFRKILNGAFLNTTDGMPLVWLGKREVGGWVDRVYGPDLMLEVFGATQGTECRHFFLRGRAWGGGGVGDEIGGEASWGEDLWDVLSAVSALEWGGGGGVDADD